jgi:hypothetical protein
MQQPMKNNKNNRSEMKYSQIDMKIKKLSERNSEKFLHGDFVKDYLFNEWQYEIKEKILSNNENLHRLEIENEKDNYNCKKNRIFEKYNSTTTDFSILNKNKHTDCDIKISMSKKVEKKTELMIFLQYHFKFLLKEVCKLTKKFEENEEKKEKILNWKFAGIVLDRFFMLIFSILTITSTVGLLITAPNFFKVI